MQMWNEKDCSYPRFKKTKIMSKTIMIIKKN